ncbi:MAG: hypothetical protein BGO51_26640 [Rhodospirillales bacterium 69-11]|nr:DUF1656 domain-containing protein [Rhodospirillales bacterium]MBN8925595.1 DUF1656 domain-containing protein [Rhodospirillales bacterium]OJW19773.1 MAG: hypothetical protein BGO51_26640 [Rhodospirillales bacterium 69-11]
MIATVDVFGLEVTALLAWLLLSLLLAAGLRRLLERAGAYRYVWHRPLFDLALLVVLLGGIVALVRIWSS